MKTPEGLEKLRDGWDTISGEELNKAADLMKEMASALYKVKAIAEMTMPNGSVAPTPLYNDVTPVLNKWEKWK